MKKLKIAIVSLLALGATALTAFSQTNISLSNTAPYYSISNSLTLGNGLLLGPDTTLGATTFDYTQGTNHLGQQVNPAGVSKSRYVAFGLIVTTTNTVAANYTAIVQEGTGYGDWVSLAPSLVVTTTTSATGGTVFTNASYDTGGFTVFRLKSIQSAEATTTNAVVTVTISSKSGI